MCKKTGGLEEFAKSQRKKPDTAVGALGFTHGLVLMI